MVGRIKPENDFRMLDGSVVRSLEELRFSLKKMDEETFRCHTVGKKNNVYDWIRDALKNKDLASDLRKTDSAGEMHQAIGDWLTEKKQEKRFEDLHLIQNAKKISLDSFSHDSYLKKIRMGFKYG